jgi:threonine dehydrogenase-like Zn-dependent dehydrogenase
VLGRTPDGPKPRLAQALGAEYHTGSIHDACGAAEPDVVLECTGAAGLMVDALQATGPGAVVCLLGISRRGRTLLVDVSALNDELVLENDLVFGSVNSNQRHYAAAAAALGRADRDWLAALITRRVPPDRWQEALDRRPYDIKTVIEFGA